MNIYLDNGYLDMRKIINIDVPFIFIVAARGTGKTYGFIKVNIEDNKKFMYLRRTQTQADLINMPEFAPYKKIAKDNDWNITSKKISKFNSAWYKNYDEGCAPFAYTGALSTIANMRGFDASDLEVFGYDEFIAEPHERTLKNEAKAFFNSFETMNRNRELEGLPPMKFIGMANSEDIANDIFVVLGFVKTCIKMQKKKQEVYINKERGVAIIMPQNSLISEQKRETALYRLTKGTDFGDMAIDNNFQNEQGRIKSKPLGEYKPIVQIGDLCLYEHKNNRAMYATTHKLGSPQIFTMGDADRARFIRQYRWVWDEYMENNIEFEDYMCEILLTKAFK